MLGFIKKLFGAKPVEAQQVEVQPEVAPYKVETPVVAEKATEAVVKSVAKPAPKKPAGQKKQGNKPRGPRKPKAPKAPKA